MNDFLEKEASTMKQYLHEISSPLSKDQCYSKFDDYIDVCKNLSILHTLFCESLTKVAPHTPRADKLQRILDGISAHLSQPVTSLPPYNRQTSLPVPNVGIVTVNGQHARSNTVELERPGYQSLQRNVFRFNDPTVTSVSVASTSNGNNCNNNNNSIPVHLPVDGSTSPKASTLPRNAHLMPATVSTNGSSGSLSAPGRRTAIDLSTSDDYVMFSALNQSADQSIPNGATPTPPRTSRYNGNTFSVKNGLTKYERVLGLQPKQGSVVAGNNVATNNGNANVNAAPNLEEFIESLQYVDESPDGGHSGGEGDNNTQGSQVSISQLSTVASSGYQSFAYSQSSSPVDPTISSGQEAGSSSGHSSSGSSSFRQSGSSPPAPVPTTVINNNGQSAAIAFTNPIYNLRNKPSVPLPRSYASSYGYETVLHRVPSNEDLSQQTTVINNSTPRVTLISNGTGLNGINGGCSPNNNSSSLSSGSISRPRISSSSSDSATPPHERRLFMSTAPRTNPRCVYPSPVPPPQQQLQQQPLHLQLSPTESNPESQYIALRRKGRKSSASSTQNTRSRIYDSSSSDSEFDQLPSTRFRERNLKRGSRNGLDRCSNPKPIDEVKCWLF